MPRGKAAPGYTWVRRVFLLDCDDSAAVLFERGASLDDGIFAAYQWLTAGYITFTAGLRVWKNQSDFEPLLFGMLILGSALVTDRVLHSFGPILSGWFPELGSLSLVVSLGVVVSHETICSYRENAVMEERVRIIIFSGREHYQKMITRRIDLSCIGKSKNYQASHTDYCFVRRVRIAGQDSSICCATTGGIRKCILPVLLFANPLHCSKSRIVVIKAQNRLLQMQIVFQCLHERTLWHAIMRNISVVLIGTLW